MRLSTILTKLKTHRCNQWLTTLIALAVVSASHGEDSHDNHGHREDAEHGSSKEDHDDHDDHGGSITLESQDIEDFGIVIAEASSGIIHEELRLPGEVRMNESTMAHVSPRYDGVVTRINFRLGDVVKPGDILATMESNETLRPFELKAPIDGTIVALHITPGESLGAGEMAYTIADTSTVWIDLRVYQRDLPRVHVGQEVHISAGHQYPEAVSSISYVGPVVDETSRTGLIRAVLPNPDGLYRPGLFVIGHVLLDEHSVPVVIPRSAVHTLEDANVVFIHAEEGEGYEPQEVRIGRGDTNSIEITRGLQPGQRYVAKGGFFLKADSQKENFGDGHAH